VTKKVRNKNMKVKDTNGKHGGVLVFFTQKRALGPKNLNNRAKTTLGEHYKKKSETIPQTPKAC